MLLYLYRITNRIPNKSLVVTFPCPQSTNSKNKKNKIKKYNRTHTRHSSKNNMNIIIIIYYGVVVVLLIIIKILNVHKFLINNDMLNYY